MLFVNVLVSMIVTFPTSHLERSQLKATAPLNTAHSNKEKSKDKNGLKKKEEHCSKIELVLPQKEEGKQKQSHKKRPDVLLERGGEKSVRTCLHVRQVPDLPCGEITIEGSSTLKHCTYTTTKKSPRIKMGWKKKRGALFKNRISAATERRREIEAA